VSASRATGSGSAAERLELRVEHGRIVRDAEWMWLAANRLPSLTLEQRQALIEETLVRLRKIGVHTAAEERVFYPMLARVLGTPRIGDALASDHRYVRARMQYLAETDPASTAALQAILYGLHAVITTHIEKEDELLAPLVEQARAARLQPPA
jgi:hemerythrin-like domain-containing protein